MSTPLGVVSTVLTLVDVSSPVRQQVSKILSEYGIPKECKDPGHESTVRVGALPHKSGVSPLLDRYDHAREVSVGQRLCW